MKPETPTPSLGSEKPAIQYGESAEVAPNPNDAKSEIEINAERHEQQAEANAIIADVGITTVIPTPVTTTVVNGTTNQISPLVANDDDLIEKEWVDRAKKIVSETQNDPKQRDDKINVLKVDYVRKRFGRELGAAE